MIILTYLLAGAFAGFIAGLFGVGGGIIMVPVFVFCFEAQGFNPSVLTHMAIASSLACIVFTSLSSTRKHHLLGAVDWRVLFKTAAGIVAGSILGVLLALQLEGGALRVLLGLFVIFIALKMAFDQGKTYVARETLSKRLMLPAGLVIGGVSSLFGIGGGTLSVPFFYRLGMPMGRVVGTAAACGFPIALVGATANIAFNLDSTLTPEYSWGYVYLPAVAVVSVCSVAFARLGAQSAQSMNSEVLKKLFSACLLLIGIKFVFF